MILSDRDIAHRTFPPGVPGWSIGITPRPAPQAFQPSSIDLRLSEDIKINPEQVGREEFIWHPLNITKNYPVTGYPMMPGQFLLASTIEEVNIPTDLTAQVEGKSRWGRLGLGVHKTAGYIDPGFRGQITLELENSGEFMLYLKPGAYICQIIFHQMTSPAARPYGSEGLGSHYQGQSGPTPARG